MSILDDSLSQHSSIDDNQHAFDFNQKREAHCAKWLKKQKKKVKGLINVVTLIGVFQGVLVIFQSALLATIFHQLVIEKQQWTQLQSDFFVLGFIFILRGFCNYFFQITGFEVAVRVKRSVRTALMNKITQLGPAFVKQQQSGALAASTLEHTEALEAYFSNYLPQQQVVTVLPLIMIALVFPVNWVVAIIFLITGPIIPVFMILVGMGASSASRNQFLAMARMGGYFLDRLQGLSTLRLFGYAETEQIKIKQVANSFREKTMSVLRIAFISSAVLEFFSAVAVALVAVYVGLGLLGLIHFGPADNISLQEALFVLLLAPEFFNPLKQLSVYYHDKAAAIGAADQVLKILELPSVVETDDLPIKSKYCIELQNVSKSYANNKVLTDFSLQVMPTEKIALSGKSGAGKTTLFNLLLGFEKSCKGRVLINGENVNRQLVQNNVAWAGQHAAIFYATIKDNISLMDASITDQKIDAAAEVAGVTEFSQGLDKGLLTLVGEKGFGLSGGQVQRIALARVFVKNSPIILLDEPTAHLDQNIKISLLDAIEQQFKGKTVIIASHDPLVIARMDRVIKLS